MFYILLQTEVCREEAGAEGTYWRLNLTREMFSLFGRGRKRQRTLFLAVEHVDEIQIFIPNVPGFKVKGHVAEVKLGSSLCVQMMSAAQLRKPAKAAAGLIS